MTGTIADDKSTSHGPLSILRLRITVVLQKLSLHSLVVMLTAQNSKTQVNNYGRYLIKQLMCHAI
jgi:hypothetical protein